MITRIFETLTGRNLDTEKSKAYAEGHKVGFREGLQDFVQKKPLQEQLKKCELELKAIKGCVDCPISDGCPEKCEEYLREECTCTETLCMHRAEDFIKGDEGE